MTRAAERDLAIVACAISAGIHAALTPAHLTEGVGVGVAFLVAAVVLAILAFALTWTTRSSVLITTAATLAGLLVSYGLAITSGLPMLHPDREAVDGLAVATKSVEVAGLLAALDLLTTKGQMTCVRIPRARFRSG
jgi:hypothetical protein